MIVLKVVFLSEDFKLKLFFILFCSSKHHKGKLGKNSAYLSGKYELVGKCSEARAFTFFIGSFLSSKKAPHINEYHIRVAS